MWDWCPNESTARLWDGVAAARFVSRTHMGMPCHAPTHAHTPRCLPAYALPAHTPLVYVCVVVCCVVCVLRACVMEYIM